jgi:hypothetical protein
MTISRVGSKKPKDVAVEAIKKSSLLQVAIAS